jgi:hypothetical protein
MTDLERESTPSYFSFSNRGLKESGRNPYIKQTKKSLKFMQDWWSQMWLNSRHLGYLAVF